MISTLLRWNIFWWNIRWYILYALMVYMNILKSSKLSTSNSLTTMLQQGDNYLANNVPVIQPGTQHWREGERNVWCLLFVQARSYHGNLHTTPLCWSYDQIYFTCGKVSSGLWFLWNAFRSIWSQKLCALMVVVCIVFKLTKMFL